MNSTQSIASHPHTLAHRRIRESAGLLLYRKQGDGLRVLLGHMGGPLFTHTDAGAWTVPKGEPRPEENLLQAAFREFEEEVGMRPHGDPWLLAPIVQRNGKRVHAWAMEADLDMNRFVSKRFAWEWPPRTGTIQQYPELDRIAWLTVDEACHLATAGQAPLFREVERRADECSG